MNTIKTILALITIIIFVCTLSCSDTQAQSSNTNDNIIDDETFVSEEIDEESSLTGVNVEYELKSFYIPMSYEYLAYVEDEEMTWGFGINYLYSDPESPLDYLRLTIGYGPDKPGITALSGRHGGYGFEYEMQSSTEFLDFINFLDENQEIFFDHSEFPDPMPEFWYPQMLGMEECFWLGTGLKTDNHEFIPCIVKGIDPGGQTPEETIDAIDFIKQEFVDVWLANEPEE